MTEDTGTSKDEKSKSDERVSPVHALVYSIQESGCELFHDQYHDPYIAFYGDGDSIAKLNSKYCKLWLIRHAYTHLKSFPTSDTISRVLQSLSSQAYFDGKRYTLGVRTVLNDEGLWYDLGEGTVRITHEKWDLPREVPILFKRSPHQEKQTKPLPGGDVNSLLKYINITNQSEQLLFLVYVIAAFLPDFPHPLLILHGAQGAGKTTPMKLMKELIDPSALGGLSAPKNIEGFVQTVSHHSFMFYDNLSKMPEWFSDTLARAATGDSFSKRELYTDDEDVIYRIQKTIALNGINQVVYKSDLLDRSILINLERIRPDQRKESQVFWTEFEEERPYILGAIFDVLVKALALYPTIKLDELPRMADFARWGFAISEAMGTNGSNFLEAYYQNIAIQHDEAIEANPVAQAIIEFMVDQNSWEGTAAKLYSVLDQIAFRLQVNQNGGWPKDAARLGRTLTIIAPNLVAKGINLERSRSKDRIITISRINHENEISGSTTEPSVQSKLI